LPFWDLEKTVSYQSGTRICSRGYTKGLHVSGG
jgi:hypothetical protein